MAEAIAGIVLNDLVAGVEGEILEGKRAEVKRAIKGIYSDVTRWEAERVRALQTATSLAEKINKAHNKIEQLKQGKWEALPPLGQSNNKTDSPAQEG